MSDEAIKEIEGLLQAQLESEKKANAGSRRNGIILVVIAACYLTGMSWVAGEFLDPEGLALAASGYAVDAVPAGAQQIHALVVEGAPDLAKLGAQQVIAQIPNYRMSLQEEIDPVIDQVCGVLADAAVKKMAEQSGAPDAKYADDAALDKAADEAVVQLDTVLNDAMNEKGEDGESPRETIDASLVQLKHIDTELARITKKGGNPQERELLMAWLNVLGQSPDMKIEVANPKDKTQ